MPVIESAGDYGDRFVWSIMIAGQFDCCHIGVNKVFWVAFIANVAVAVVAFNTLIVTLIAKKAFFSRRRRRRCIMMAAV